MEPEELGVGTNKRKQLPTWLCTKTLHHYEKLQRVAEQHEPPREFLAPADEWMVTGFAAAVAEAKAALLSIVREEWREQRGGAMPAAEPAPAQAAPRPTSHQ